MTSPKETKVALCLPEKKNLSVDRALFATIKSYMDSASNSNSTAKVASALLDTWYTVCGPANTHELTQVCARLGISICPLYSQAKVA
jgi:hypothetical protein